MKIVVRCGLVWGALLWVQGCATASVHNFEVKYKLAGPANETAALNASAEREFRAVLPEERKEEVSRVAVYLDTVPPQLTLRNNVVEVREGSAARLTGLVEVEAVWRLPDEPEVLPLLQKAALSVSADIAFCPRSEKPAAHVWRCYLVSTGSAPRRGRGFEL